MCWECSSGVIDIRPVRGIVDHLNTERGVSILSRWNGK